MSTSMEGINFLLSTSWNVAEMVLEHVCDNSVSYNHLVVSKFSSKEVEQGDRGKRRAT